MLRTILLAVLTISLGVPISCRAFADDHLAGDIHAFAPVKRPKLPIVGRETLGFIFKGPYPAHGLMLVRGSFLSPGAGWTIIDFDAWTISILQTSTQTLPDGEREGIISDKRVVGLQPQELNEVIDGANRIWNPPPTPEPPPSMVTDVTCDLVLFDESEIIHDSGFACQSVQLIARIEAISREKR